MVNGHHRMRIIANLFISDQRLRHATRDWTFMREIRVTTFPMSQDRAAALDYQLNRLVSSVSRAVGRCGSPSLPH